MVIGVIYRPPSENTLEFIEKVNEMISGVTKSNKRYYIAGDFNLDLLKHESHSITAQFIESLFAFGFQPVSTKPTRITAHSATLIDNIFTNNTTVSSKSGLIISDISDHLPIFSIVFGDYLPKDSNSFTIRDTSEIRVNEFRHKLELTGSSLIRPTMPMTLTPLTIFSSISTLAYLTRVSLLKLSKVKL